MTELASYESPIKPNSMKHMAVKTKLPETRKYEEMGKILIAERRSSGTKRENLILISQREKSAKTVRKRYLC